MRSVFHRPDPTLWVPNMILDKPAQSLKTTRWQALTLWLFCVIYFAFSVTYMFLSPPFEGPDSGAHYNYVVYLHRNLGYPPMTIEVASFSHQLVQQPPFYYALVRLFTRSAQVEDAMQFNISNPYYGLGLSNRATVTPSQMTWPSVLPLWTARVISALGGLVLLLSTYGLTRRLLYSNGVAFAVASATVLNPQFLFGAASITNDTWAAALTTMTLWLAVRAIQTNAANFAWGFVGLVLGLAGLAKYSALLVALPLGALIVYGTIRQGWRAMLVRSLFVTLGMGVSAGFWFGHNLLL